MFTGGVGLLTGVVLTGSSLGLRVKSRGRIGAARKLAAGIALFLIGGCFFSPFVFTVTVLILALSCFAGGRLFWLNLLESWLVEVGFCTIGPFLLALLELLRARMRFCTISPFLEGGNLAKGEEVLMLSRPVRLGRIRNLRRLRGGRRMLPLVIARAERRLRRRMGRTIQ